MPELLVGVLSCSNSCHLGESDDSFGKAAAEACSARGFDVVAYHVCPDDVECIEASLIEMCDVDEADLVITVGGTGLKITEVTPEATLAAGVRQVPGIAEAIRVAATSADDRAMLSRGVSVQRGRTLIVNLPACESAFEAALDWLLDRADVLWKGSHA